MHLENLGEGQVGYPHIKTSSVVFESAVEEIHGHIGLGRDLYIPVNGRFCGEWDGYPWGKYESARESGQIAPTTDGYSRILHVMASDRPALVVKTLAVGTEDADRIVTTLRDLGLHVFSGHSVETHRVGTDVEPYGVSHLVSHAFQDAKGVHIAFVGERKPLVLSRPEHSAVMHTAMWASDD